MFFFFKQKTAYEMRISDWSSDVCSSDLRAATASADLAAAENAENLREQADKAARDAAKADKTKAHASGGSRAIGLRTYYRLEEHTSELQSLMRISYAVFCLNKNKINSIILAKLQISINHNIHNIPLFSHINTLRVM